ncbi:hypothetical protein EST38_g5802 [Candolleomyces aberdarensis]|uniref:Uncharacterized protein n=1 Tax=Candolleomyces aberdarensis TaxID=2316362 RepID=A0A4Q2DLH5_9AGAR|nr:hypothetical protein EST38_g5802 [Candolleomyces aberdarensis]
MLQDLIAEVAALAPQQLLALGIFTSYFALILWLFTRVLDSIQIASSQNERGRKSSLIDLFWILTAASFAHTWFYMFQYMAWSFSNFEAKNGIAASSGILMRVANWLCETSLFEEAWAAVCFGKMNWWWSEQLCLFTVGAWTIFLYVEGSHHQIKHVWAYMLLGQVVAISVASNLFYIALLSAKSQPRREGSIAVPAKLWIPVFISLATIPISPFTDEKTFLPNLLIMHVLIVLPLLSVSPLKVTKTGFSLSIFYLTVFLCSIPIRSRTVLNAASVLPEIDQSPYALFRAAWTTLHSHPAQSSIGWDVVWTTISFVIWIVVSSTTLNLFTTIYLLVASPFASVGVTAPYVLRPRTHSTSDSETKDD